MDAGKLTTRIIIQQDISDGTTEPIWTEFKTLWANKQGLGGRVFYQAQAVQSESDIIYTIRYRKGIHTGMRILDDDATLRIKAPPNDKENKKMWLEIHASEVTS